MLEGLRRKYHAKLGQGKKAIEGSESDYSGNEVAEILRRTPPSTTLKATPLEEGEETYGNNLTETTQANGDEAAEYILEALGQAEEVINEEFTVPHRENLRGQVEVRRGFIGGTATITTGDTSFEYSAEVVVDSETETIYGDLIPEGEYRIEVSSNALDDDSVDAAVGNIESQSQTIRVTPNELIDYFQGKEGELHGIDKNADGIKTKALRSGWNVLSDDVLQGGDGDEAAEFVSNMSEGYEQPWSGVIHEMESGKTGIWHASIPGSKDKSEGERPEITGEINQPYQETLNELT